MLSLRKESFPLRQVLGVRAGPIRKGSRMFRQGEGDMMSPLDHYNNLLYQYIEK